MTRETKIGLLVGLAFIIVIGILLSDHLTSSTEPPPAVLAQAGNSVRQTTITPGGSGPQSIVSAAPGNVSPTSQVPTNTELSQPPRQPPITIVNVGPGQSSNSQNRNLQNDSPVVIGPGAPNLENAGQVQPEPLPLQSGPEVVSMGTLPVDSSLQGAARSLNEELVPLDSSGRATAKKVNTSWTQALTGMREYKAEAGDSLSRIASKCMGANTKANRDAIIAANPSLQADPNKLISGRTYVIPIPGEAPPVATSSVQPTDTVPTAATEYWYTVKEGDSLWKIAVDQCGKGSAVAAIKELNKDTLKGSDTVIVNMRLRLPGKPVAVANN